MTETNGATTAESFDAIVIGGGINGLICAGYLAKAKMRVLLVEARSEVGGLASETILRDDYRVPTCGHLIQGFSKNLVRDLGLERHGLRAASVSVPTVLLDEHGKHIVLSGIDSDVKSSIGAHAENDAAAYLDFVLQQQRIATALRPVFDETPASMVALDRSDKQFWIGVERALTKLPGNDADTALRNLGASIADVLSETFESELLQGGVAFDAVLGNSLGPRSPGSYFTYLQRQIGACVTSKYQWTIPKGGMGEFCKSLKDSAEAFGVVVRTDCSVRQIRTREQSVSGVLLANGDLAEAPIVVSSLDPKTTFLDLLPIKESGTEFLRHIRRLKTRGATAKINLALEGLPTFAELDGSALAGRLIISPTVDGLEQAFNASKYGEYSRDPAIELTIPTLTNPGLAPDDHHILSIVAQYAPYEINGGWTEHQEAFANRVISMISRYAPDLQELVLAGEVLTPEDIEREFGNTGGHWHHAEITPHQFLGLRPSHFAGKYESPIPGLYLCGVGSHPGGGITGLSGQLAAKTIIANGSR